MRAIKASPDMLIGDLLLTERKAVQLSDHSSSVNASLVMGNMYEAKLISHTTFFKNCL